MTERAVRWTHAAEADLHAIVDCIAANEPANARHVLDRLLTRAASLRQQAERGRRIPELRGLGLANHRELVVAPWRMLYRIADSQVDVLAVLDTRRDLRSLLFQRLLQGR